MLLTAPMIEGGAGDKAGDTAGEHRVGVTWAYFGAGAQIMAQLLHTRDNTKKNHVIPTEKPTDIKNEPKSRNKKGTKTENQRKNHL